MLRTPLSRSCRAPGSPVKWIEDRYEHLISACHSRDQIHDVEIGFDNEGRILALRIVLSWTRARTIRSACRSPITRGSSPGPVKIPNLSRERQARVHDQDAERAIPGAGRPEAVQAMERLIDLIANKLGLEPAEVRRRNMVQASRCRITTASPIATANRSCSTAATIPRLWKRRWRRSAA